VSGQIQGQNETLTLYIFRAFEERQDVQGNVVALLLAGVSIVLLAAIEIFKRKRSKDMGK
jgi:ABC-type molybdate transport system permease subunit